MIAMASVLLVPISFFTKDKFLKYLIEQIDTKEADADEDVINEIFNYINLLGLSRKIS